MKIPWLGVIALLFFVGQHHITYGQKRLDSIIRYNYTSDGKDSFTVGKRIFDYNTSGQLSAERVLRTSDFIKWENGTRKQYEYDIKERLERTNKDSLISSGTTWRNHFYRTRTYSSDSDFVIRYHRRKGSTFETILKKNEVSYFADGRKKSRTTRHFNTGLQSWVLIASDTLIRDYHLGIEIEYNDRDLNHKSGLKVSLSRPDSISSIPYPFAKSWYNLKVKNAPANQLIFVTKRERTAGFKDYYTSDSLIYFLNSGGLPDSSHLHILYWHAPQSNGIEEKTFYDWNGKKLIGIRLAAKLGRSILSIYDKMDFYESTDGLIKDTIFYEKRNGFVLGKEQKKTTRLNKMGQEQSTSYFIWNALVDSFSIDAKEIYYYSSPPTSITGKPMKTSTLNVYPNPSRGQLHIESEIEGHLLLYDLQGRIIQRIAPDLAGNIFLQKKGLYLLRHTLSGKVVHVVVQ